IAPMPLSLLKVEDSLARVRSGLESRARRIEGRVGQELAAHISRPGKMLRSRFALLLAGALGVDEAKAEGVSRAMELVHNASLLHDDCVDEAELRRGHPTPNKIFGTTVGLLLGDLAFAQGLEEAVDISPSAPRLLTTTVREMTVGELQEEFLKGSLEVDEKAYMGVASRKTGALFEWAGAVLSELSPFPHEQADPPRLACAAGILLQIVDDIHDYTLSERVSGKDEAQDLLNRKLTLPCIYALTDPSSREEFLRLWEAPAPDARAIGLFLQQRGHLQKTRATGRQLVDSMLAMIRKLPCQGEAKELAFFVEIMAKREF
ncbi:MAG TPA: polyprenyl synthetase family protein, partial [Elusimicrobiota bacterium]|nr:polyprenyl synthetase family protein [Elusimicrobiota bacterium]